LETSYPERLKVVHTLTREDDPSRYGPNVYSGRLDEELLRKLVPEPLSCHFYVCGPAVSVWDRRAAADTGVEPKPRFLESALSALTAMGVAKNRIVRESYG